MQNKGPAPFLDHDFVYNSYNTGEFKSVHLGVKVTEDSMEFIIESEYLPEIIDLTNILKTVQSDTLNKLKLDIWKDFNLILKLENETHEVVINAETKEVVSIK